MRIVLIDKHSRCSGKQEPPPNPCKILINVNWLEMKEQAVKLYQKCNTASSEVSRGYLGEGWCSGKVSSLTHALLSFTSPFIAGSRGVGLLQSCAPLAASSVGYCNHRQVQCRCLIQKDPRSVLLSITCCAPPRPSFAEVTIWFRLCRC